MLCRQTMSFTLKYCCSKFWFERQQCRLPFFFKFSLKNLLVLHTPDSLLVSVAACHQIGPRSRLTTSKEFLQSMPDIYKNIQSSWIQFRWLLKNLTFVVGFVWLRVSLLEVCGRWGNGCESDRNVLTASLLLLRHGTQRSLVFSLALMAVNKSFQVLCSVSKRPAIFPSTGVSSSSTGSSLLSSFRRTE